MFKIEYKLFFISNSFINNARLKFAKNQAKGKQHLEAKLLLFEYHWLFHPRYHPKIIGNILKNVQKTGASVLMRLYDDNENEAKNGK